MTFDQLVDRAMAQFDTDLATAVRVVNERHQQMLADSEYLEVEKSLGNTTAGTYSYALPDESVDVRRIEIAGNVYDPVALRKMRDLLAGRSNLNGSGGVFAKRTTSAGVTQLDVFPVPDTSGLAITAFESLVPADKTYGTSAVLSVPIQYQPQLWAGVQAALYLEVDERPDMADVHESTFQTGIAQMIRFKNKRVGSPSGNRIQVAGFDFG